MRLLAMAPLSVLLASLMAAAPQNALATPANLDLETAGPPGAPPVGWQLGGSPTNGARVEVTEKQPRQGRRSAIITSDTEGSVELSQAVVAGRLRGQRVKVRAAIRAAGKAWLWVR